MAAAATAACWLRCWHPQQRLIWCATVIRLLDC
jgi:hypothetical protein